MTLFAVALAAAVAAGAQVKPPARVSRASVVYVERTLDTTIARINPSDPYELLGTTRGVYLAGYGAVFTCELNLTITYISPFVPPLTAADIDKLHEKKLVRLAQLKTVLRDALVSAAGALEDMPANEQVVIGVTLFYRSFEHRQGLPSQVVIQAPRQALLDFKAGRAQALEGKLKVEELS